MIHRYQSNGYNIVLDVNSGSVHAVDGIVYEMIPHIEPLYDSGIKDADTIKAALLHTAHLPYSEEEIVEAADEILELAAEGKLFARDIYEPYISAFGERETIVKALCLHIAHDCNLACRYCFAQEGEYHGDRALMSAEVGRKALDFLVASSGTRRNLEVDFFGGEPTLNFGVVKEIVAYGRSLEREHGKNFRFTLTTNGILLNDEILDFANRECANIVLSIDGRREVNDRMRPFRGAKVQGMDGAGSGSGIENDTNVTPGRSSYDVIVPKFLKTAQSRNQTNYYVRGTYTRCNLDFSEDVLHLADLGFRQISVEPVVARPEDDYAIREEDLPFLKEQYDRLAAEMIRRRKNGNPFNFFHFMIDLSGGPCVYKRLSGCGAGCEYLAVTPWGDLYPCHQFVGNEKFRVGSVYEGILRTDIQEEFRAVNVYAKEKCRRCFAKFYCSGGCSANAYNFHGDIRETYEIGCELQRKRVECAVMLKVDEMYDAEQSEAPGARGA